MKHRILIVDDESAIRSSLKMFLDDEGFDADIAANGEEALEKIKEDDFEIILSDIKMPVMDGLQLMEEALKFSPGTFFIIMTAFASVETAVESLRMGAFDYIIKPVDFDNLLIKIQRLIDYKKLSFENKTLRQRLSSESGYKRIIGSSAPMKKVFEIIERVAPTNSNVLIYGKSGTGKELVAKAIHHKSKRSDNIFLPVNCGAISESLIESELFGHKKGSFTGATDEKQGLFKVAEGGTLFLDEIGDLPLNLQVKLLRALEDKKFLPVGGVKPISSDVRIIAATNQNLFEKAKKGEFREDLYYRLNVVDIKLPSLNERKDDIPLLVNHFIEKYCNEMGKKIIGIQNDTLKALMSHNWRGGVRELENVIERAIIFATEDIIKVEDLSDNINKTDISDDYPDSLREAMKSFEREHISKTIKKFNMSKEQAAKALNIGLSSLYRKMEELDIPTKIKESNESGEL